MQLVNTTKLLRIIVVLSSIFIMTNQLTAQGLLIKNGETIAFLGNSITQFATSPTGYISLVANGLEAKGVSVKTINAGVSGNVSTQMLDRLDKDVISKKPNWMTLSCGVNDVWHGATGVSLDQYKINITKIIDKVQAVGIKVIILTATMIGEDQTADFNKKLVPYNNFLRELAKEKNCLLADLNLDMMNDVTLAAAPKGVNVLTNDGVHMNALGYQMMAIGILKTQGFTSDELDSLKEKWMNYQTDVTGKYKLTVRQFKQLSEIVKEQGLSVPDLMNRELMTTIDKYLKKKK